MKRVYLYGLMILIVLMITACAVHTDETKLAPTATITSAFTPSPTPSPKPCLTPIPVSFTTGLPFEGKYTPVIAVIENSEQARPQIGLQIADVVYEVPVEGSITRFLCVFSDNVPEEVMPVRSARIPFAFIQHEWDAVFMHFGGAGSGPSERNAPYSFYGHDLYNQIKIDVDGLSGRWNEYYQRVSSRSKPHNVMGNPLLAQKLYDYQPKPLTWLFDIEATYMGADVLECKLAMCSGDEDYISYLYDKVNDEYLRFMHGKEFIAGETDEQVAVKNIIVQYTTYKTSEGRKDWKLVGSGDADFYIGGKLIRGRWERASADDETVFYDDQGIEIVLRPGNTWIHIHPEL